MHKQTSASLGWPWVGDSMFIGQEGDNRTRQPGKGREHHLKEDEVVEDASSIVADGFGSAHVQSGDDSFQLHHLHPGDTVCGIRICASSSDSKAAACAAYLGSSGPHRKGGVGRGSSVKVCVVGGQVLGEVDVVSARVDEWLSGSVRIGERGLHECHGDR